MTVVLHSAAGTGTRPVAFTPLADIVRCPRCSSRLAEISERSLVCRGCGERYPVIDGIPQLLPANEGGDARPDVTERDEAFHEAALFPGYDDVHSRESLQQKARTGILARLLDAQLPPEVMVLDMGCGIGQLTNFLAINWQRRVIGADVCMNSLALAKGFRDRFAIVNADFVQMNLFRPPFADNSMDVIICNAVLHHTSDPEGGFRAIAAKLKPGGYVLVGLYNWLGRLPALWRRRLLEMFGDRMAWLDAWFRDQDMPPQGSSHSMDEVLRWFEHNRIAFVSSIPSIGDVDFNGDQPIFRRQSAGRRLDRWSSEVEMLLAGGAAGGLFIMIGQKLEESVFRYR
jgi:SAM-dependent methyltransferase